MQLLGWAEVRFAGLGFESCGMLLRSYFEEHSSCPSPESQMKCKRSDEGIGRKANPPHTDDDIYRPAHRLRA
jgi:hypothetical protein